MFTKEPNYDSETKYVDCDHCGNTEDDLTGCGECEMRFCGECLANYVTDAGCIYCNLGLAAIEAMDKSLSSMISELKSLQEMIA